MINDKPKIAALQHESRANAIDENLERMGIALRGAANQNVELAVLPEAGLQGYGYDEAGDVYRDAVSLSDPLFRHVCEVVASTGIYTIVGFIERDCDRIFNSTALVDPKGQVVTIHRKIHLPSMGVDRFVEPGYHEPPVAHTPFGRIGMLICADMIFPESARVAALQGADAIAISACVPQPISIYSDALVRVRAYENCVYVIFADMTGSDGDWRYEGSSQIVDASGQLVAEAPIEGDSVLTATLDANNARTKVRTREPYGGIPHRYTVDFFGQRHPELYGRITDQAGVHAFERSPLVSTPRRRTQGGVL